MTTDQYTDLVGFLGRKFEALDRRFETIDREFQEVRRHATVLFDQARDERRHLGEGLHARLETVIEDHERRLQALEGS